MTENGFNNFTRMNAGPVDCPVKEFFEAEDTVTVIQPENGERFVFQVSRMEFHILL